MAITFRAVIDGEVLRPEHPLDLKIGATYIITVEREIDQDDLGSQEVEIEYSLTQIGRLAVDMGVDDLAANHDWYTHGKLRDEQDDQG